MAKDRESEQRMCKLTELEIGQSGTVTSVRSRDSELLRKLLAMGIVAGTTVQVCNVAPLGDPIEIKARGYNLSLRLSEAFCVEISHS